MEKKTNDDHAFVKWYVQHSKKLSSASLVQWVIVAVAVFLLVFFYDVDSYEASLLEHVIQWSANITVASVGGYMLNSAVEKACRQKLKTIVSSAGEETSDTYDTEDEIAGYG